jgi:endonuclease YncB( thermonuclease family)
MGRGGLVEFKPARRVFAGRGRSLLTFGEWKIAFASMAFGGAVTSGWLIGQTEFKLPMTLSQPVMAQPVMAQPVMAATINEAPVAAPVEAVLPVSAAAESMPAIEPESDSEEILPQIVVADNDGRRSRTDPPADFTGRVSRVVDGDTFYLEGLATRIRLWGVDAPERDEEGFDAATTTLAELVAGKTLSCEHVDTDKYKRIVARCYFPDGGDLSAAMIESGAASEYQRFTDGYYSTEP